MVPRTGRRIWIGTFTNRGSSQTTEVFVDTSFAIAVTVSTDRYHETAVRLARKLRSSRAILVTTQAILAEIGDSFSRPPYRAAATQLLRALQRDSDVLVLPVDSELFSRGHQ